MENRTGDFEGIMAHKTSWRNDTVLSEGEPWGQLG